MDIDKWDDEVVFKIYCNDNLRELPRIILLQMKDYIDKILEEKADTN